MVCSSFGFVTIKKALGWTFGLIRVFIYKALINGIINNQIIPGDFLDGR